MDVTLDWFWEGNVVEAIARFLVRDGWTVVGKTDTHSKQRGVDIHATRSGRTLLVEAKGYPSKSYRDPRRAGEVKPTNPTSQAQQWYSRALLKVMRLQTKYPDAVVALGLPDFPRYRALFEETRGGLATLGVARLTVREDGTVETWRFNDQVTGEWTTTMKKATTTMKKSKSGAKDKEETRPLS
jgi:hypothetical protein